MCTQLSKIRSLFHPIPYILILFLGMNSEKINPDLSRTLATKNKANVFITFDVETTQTLATIREKIRGTKNRAQKLQTIAQALENQANKSQAKALEIAKADPSLEYRLLWITNQMYIYNATKELINKLEALNEVTQIDEDTLQIVIETPKNSTLTRNPKQSLHTQFGPVTWGIQAMKVPEVWSQGYFGQDVIVAVMDSGVELHDANRDNFIGLKNFGWHAPGWKNSTYPFTHNDHGTHCMGTIVGHFGIGVAPGAKWMTCHMGTAEEGPDRFVVLLLCFQHFLCPGGWQNGAKSCIFSPRVISNSWGYTRLENQTLKNQLVSALKAFEEAGTFVVWAAANLGPACETLSFPQTLPFVFSVGAFNFQNEVANFSSSGPGVNRTVVKPDLVAPGVDILSALNYDGYYRHMGGTSMACPHVAGVVALMLSKNPAITEDQIREALIKATEPTVPESGDVCKKIPLDVYPNFRSGYGKLNALKAVEYIPKP